MPLQHAHRTDDDSDSMCTTRASWLTHTGLSVDTWEACCGHISPSLLWGGGWGHTFVRDGLCGHISLLLWESRTQWSEDSTLTRSQYLWGQDTVSLSVNACEDRIQSVYQLIPVRTGYNQCCSYNNEWNWSIVKCVANDIGNTDFISCSLW